MFAYEELDFRDVFSRILTPSSGTVFRDDVKENLDFMLYALGLIFVPKWFELEG